MPLTLTTLYPSEEVFCTTQRSNHAECVTILELAETFELEQTLLGCVCVCMCVCVCVCVCVGVGVGLGVWVCVGVSSKGLHSQHAQTADWW